MSRPASRSAIVLCVLTALFAARVGAQALVAIFGVTCLPPMNAWYSGLLPYPLLLPIQIFILAVQTVIDRDVWRGRGFFACPRPRTARALRWIAGVYALSMVVRFVLMPSHSIPIVFHWVLAAYLFMLGRLAPAASDASGARQPSRIAVRDAPDDRSLGGARAVR